MTNRKIKFGLLSDRNEETLEIIKKLSAWVVSLPVGRKRDKVCVVGLSFYIYASTIIILIHHHSLHLLEKK